MTKLIAVLGEVEENPLAMPYEALQERLTETLVRLNRALEADLVLSITSSGGFPEFAAVLRYWGPTYTVARTIAEAFHPLPVRVAAAEGEVPESIWAQPDPDQFEGPAFDAAGELLYHARKEDRMLLVQSSHRGLDVLANALFLVLYRNLQQWTERQAEVVRLYREHGRQLAVAEHLGVSQQSVSSSLAAAGWKMVADAETALDRVFGDGEIGGTTQTG